ncbi:hypothetical protein AJ80_05948 [Polytolypa hystricis UAMH7299]|uniref:Molybdate-anion transporter n=1 Tax=Polytolypa hystricis (strain UAMH7299) TaxID=1447883 RepID=A0A2B7Y0N5_POLH7|nr:hypothetical protein AJ80_05948 [Polytolypa hystricis UAMH7299]
MDIHVASLIGLILANAAVAARVRRAQQPENNKRGGATGLRSIIHNIRKVYSNSSPQDNAQNIGLGYTFFPVYALVVASDWLQGPYLYPLYKQTLNLPENFVATLFATGFISGALSATFAGKLADQYGRRRACQAFCVIYALSCLLTLSSNIFLLFLGRALGGIGTTLLFTVFETWMVSEFHQRTAGGEGELSSLLGTMTALNSIVAVLSGLLSQFLVQLSETRRAPFVASIGCLILALLAISRTWSENYGQSTAAKAGPTANPLKDRISTIIKDKRILTLGITSTIFEGTMYLFVVFWSPAMIAARALSTDPSSPPSDPPFGIIFAAFMAAMMLGSQLFTHSLLPSSTTPSPATDNESPTLSRATHLLKLLLPLSSACLSLSLILRYELSTLWSFAIFELCVGMYYPSMGVLKSGIVSEKHRANVYALFRVPLNVFVALALGMTEEGEAFRGNVFMTCSALLVGAVGCVYAFMDA